ncbi:hypothetical protein [Nocardiopsis sp. LOL_012]|uniref:hypothetical protein n=1 Tax=Nocardiopsis sp. LOL_012 TaxID=3345409 RepID=UPI003A896A49
MEARVHERAHALAGSGIVPGTRAAVRMSHDTASVTTFLAASRAGANVLLLPQEGEPPAVARLAGSGHG